MGQDPGQIRREIEETRGRMTDTVEAIGYRADVKTRAKEGIVERKNRVVGAAGDVVHRVTGAMPDVSMPDVSVPDVSMPGFVPDGDRMREGARQAKHGARQAVSVAQSNPIGLAVGAIAVGFLAGMLVPATRAEDERLGDLSDRLREQARDAGQQALQHGREIASDAAGAAQEAAREAAQTVQETVQQSGQEHGQSLAESVRDGVQDLRDGA
jgi:gas vesicle protein